MARSKASISICISMNLLRALGLVAVERSSQHLRLGVPVLDHALAGLFQRFESLTH
jgi:hypothetical protein